MRFLISTYLSLLTSLSFTTGPSNLIAIIHPIAINNSGIVLCKTKYSQNAMGAYNAMDVYYGYCIISKDAIIEFAFDTLFADENVDWKVLEEQTKLKEVEFEKNLDSNNLNWIEQKLITKYHFNQTQLKLQERVIQLNEVKPQITSTKQKTIRGGLSNHYETNKLLVIFETDDFIFVQNIIPIEDTNDSPMYGAIFDFNNYLTLDDGSLQDIGFDLFNVTGILIKKN